MLVQHHYIQICTTYTVSHLHVFTQGEVLPHRMALKAIVGEDPSQVGVVGKEDTIHVPHLQQAVRYNA